MINGYLQVDRSQKVLQTQLLMSIINPRPCLSWILDFADKVCSVDESESRQTQSTTATTLISHDISALYLFQTSENAVMGEVYSRMDFPESNLM